MRFLIVKTSALGDIIHAFPVVEYLKQRYPESIIDWVVELPFSELVKANPLVNQTYCIRSKTWRKAFLLPSTWKDIWAFKKELQQNTYDAVFDLQGNTKSGMVTKLAKSSVKVGFAKETVSEFTNTWITNQRFNPPPHQNVRNECLSIVQQYAQDESIFSPKGVLLTLTEVQKRQIDQISDPFNSSNQLKIMVCPGAFWPNKQLSLQTLQNLLDEIASAYDAHFFMAWGSPTEHELAKQLGEHLSERATILPKMPLPALQNLMGQMHLVIAMDSLPLHLAGTTGTKTFSLFGPSSAEKYKPEGPNHFAVQGSCPYGKTFDRRCSKLRTCSTGACIKDLMGSSLFHDFQKWWK